MCESAKVLNTAAGIVRLKSFAIVFARISAWFQLLVFGESQSNIEICQSDKGLERERRPHKFNLTIPEREVTAERIRALSDKTRLKRAGGSPSVCG